MESLSYGFKNLFSLIKIRRLAIKELPSFCKDSKENTPKISDILAQLLNAAEPTEVQQVNLSLQALSKVIEHVKFITWLS